MRSRRCAEKLAGTRHALEGVQQVVERPAGVEAGAPLVAVGEALRRVAAGNLDHEVDVDVPEVVADPHAAQDHRLVVDLVELGVVEPFLGHEPDLGVREQRGAELARALPQGPPATLERHQEQKLNAGMQVNLFVEEALLGRLQVLVVAPDSVLEDRNLDAAVGGRQQGARDRLPGVVVAPLETANHDAPAGLANPGQDRLEGHGASGQELECRGPASEGTGKLVNDIGSRTSAQGSWTRNRGCA